MTPKEKANQLVDKFDTFDVLGENHNGFTAQQCALVAVDEMIRIAAWGGDFDNEIEDGSKEYYMKVKQEIEKL
jgi:hypothetical protein